MEAEHGALQRTEQRGVLRGMSAAAVQHARAESALLGAPSASLCTLVPSHHKHGGAIMWPPC